MTNSAPYFIYILRCNNGAYYTGYTTDLVRRYAEHVAGTAKCKFTRSFKPLNIAQSWEINASKSVVLQIEKSIKKLTKKQKEELIGAPLKLLELFPELNLPARIINYEKSRFRDSEKISC